MTLILQWKFIRCVLIALIMSQSFFTVAEPIKIMPMGDSITKGGGYPVGSLDSPSYRYYLFNSLLKKGWNVDFVGPMTGVAGSSKEQPYQLPVKYADVEFPFFVDQDFSGDTGWTIDRFLQGRLSAEHLMKKYQPEIVLIHLGTNNIGARLDSPISAANKMGRLVDLIRLGNSGTKIFIAKIIPLLDHAYAQGAGEYELVKRFNIELENVIRNKNTQKQFFPIVLVDMWNYVNPALMLAEKTHPNNRGDKKIAALWLAAINETGMSDKDYIFWNQFQQTGQ